MTTISRGGAEPLRSPSPRRDLSDAGHTRLVWLNLLLSILAGFAAVALGQALGEVL
jgi:hypothetical protein